ncbi:MAG: phosphoribosyltransferase [Prosthecobacter sp.]|nr:phosphoribosyltransferase [Prosthecobacter sp.]
MISEKVRFENRQDAGRRLAQRLLPWKGRPDLVVLGLPRGGVPVAFEIAAALGVRLDVWMVRKLGMPGHEELAMGAIASGGVTVLNEEVISLLSDARGALAKAIERESRELARRESAYRRGRAAPDLTGKTVILADDGLATGATMRAAVKALKKHGVARCVVAVPVGSAEACANLQNEADEVICLAAPESFRSVGEFYEEFDQTTDDEVGKLLAAAENWPQKSDAE